MGRPCAGSWGRSGDDHGATRGPGAGLAGAGRFSPGMDSLAALVQVTLRLDPFAGDVFVFRSRRSDRVKLILYDGTGLILITKRLEAGQFKWPLVTDGVVRLSALQLSVLLSGLPWERLQAPPIFRPRAAC